MKQHPILFSTPMVQAILQGNKTQTRRIVKPQPIGENLKWPTIYSERSLTDLDMLNKCPYGQVGDILWVRETFAFTKGEFQPYDTLSYKADNFHRDIKREGIKYKKD